MATARKPAHSIPSLRWWIAGILFASTVINYVDRQTLSLLAPYLKLQYRWSNSDYANLVIGFRVAYAIGQTVFGRMMDRVGTRRGLTLTVAWYSVVSVATSLARGFYSFAGHFGFCWARENRQTGQQRPKRFRSGFQNANARWRLRFSTAGRRSEARLRRLSFCQFTFAGDGGLRS